METSSLTKLRKETQKSKRKKTLGREREEQKGRDKREREGSDQLVMLLLKNGRIRRLNRKRGERGR